MRWVSILVCWMLMAGAGRSQETRVLGAAEVCQLAGLLRKDLDLVATRLGTESNVSIGLSFQGAGPRELHAEARFLFQKAARLLAEQCWQSAEEPQVPGGEPTMQDVYSVLKEVVAVVRTVKHHHGILASTTLPPIDQTALPDDACHELAQCAQLLERLLRRKTEPADVYLNLNRSVAHAMGIYLSFSGRRIPTEPTLNPKTTMGDVNVVLSSCFDIEGEIADRLGMRMARISRKPRASPTLLEADLLANLVLAELVEIHRQLGIERAVPKAVYQEVRDLNRLAERGALLGDYLGRVRARLDEGMGGAKK